MARFINEAQVYHRRFFETTQTNLFTKILQRLTAKTAPRPTIKELMTTLRNIQKQDHKFRKLGLELDDWNYRQIANLVRQAGDRAATENVSNALSSFVEVLESRAHERALVAERLETFVRIMGEFFHDKSVTLSARAGLRITTKAPAKRVLKEHQLSTGEYHLLYLMVAALVTQRRGTVIAIDEPEMSMHLAWQRRLIKALFECASKAEPQFIFATHSPDIAADFPEALVKVGG